jgi:hypothetical protein
MLALGFVLVAGLGALVEDKGLTRGILNNPDLRPQMESKTKFSDVKGVDEAKVSSISTSLCQRERSNFNYSPGTHGVCRQGLGWCEDVPGRLSLA